MSSTVGTARAGRTKDKSKSTAVSAYNAVNKTEKVSVKNQATVEQLRMAQVIDSGKDAANMAAVKQLCELTGRSEDDVIVALHDAQNNTEMAAHILLDENVEKQGEWEVQEKKKKRSNNQKSDKDSQPINSTHDTDYSRPDRSYDRRGDHDRQDSYPRRGRDRRNGGPPPRMANRGRGRERMRGDRERETNGYQHQDRHHSQDTGVDKVNGEEDWEADSRADFQRRPDRERGFGGDRGRGRGRGGGGFGRPGSRGGRPRRFERQNDASDSGPHIDTWDSEPTVSQDNTAWSDQWVGPTEDWCDDQWTGSLDGTKVFTSTQNKPLEDSDLTVNHSEPTNSIGQRLDVGSLFSRSAEFPKAPDFTKSGEATSGDSFFSTYNQQAAESIKNSIGIGSSSSQSMSSQPVSLGQLPAMPQRDRSRPHTSNGSLLPSSSPSPSSLPSSSMFQQSLSSLPPSSMMPSASSLPPPSLPHSPMMGSVSSVPSQSAMMSSATMGAQQAGQVGQPQRRLMRTKLPPPSKIPSRAVEMPGDMIPRLDVEFGVDFGAEAKQYGFGAAGDSTSFGNTPPPTSCAVGGPVGQAGSSSQSSEDRSLSTTPVHTAGLPLDSSPARPSVFPPSPYSSPSKADSAANKGSGEPVPFPSPAADHKTSSLINSQRSSHSPSLSQDTGSSSKPDNSYSSSNGYPDSYNSHFSLPQAHKPSPTPSSQTFSPSSTQTTSSFPSQYSSQMQYSAADQLSFSMSAQGQGQFPEGNSSQFSRSGGAMGNQYPAQYGSSSSQSGYGSAGVSQNQYQGAGSQYHGSYQSGSASFQNQSAPSQNMYSNQSQSSSGVYPPASSSFHDRDSQSGNAPPSGGSVQPPSSSLPPSAASQPTTTYPSQQSSSQGVKKPPTSHTASYNSSYPPQNCQLPPPVSSQSSTTYNSSYSSHQNQGSNTQSATTFSQTFSSSPQTQVSTAQNPAMFSQTFSTQSQPTTTHSASYSSQGYGNQTVQSGSLGNKLGDSMSKMSLKETPAPESQSSQFDQGSVSSSSMTTGSVTSSTGSNTTTISTSTSTVSATSTPMVTNTTIASRAPTANNTAPISSKAPPNFPPGVPLVGNPHLFMGQAAAAAAAGGLPPYFGLQQPMYNFEELQMLQQARLPMHTGNFYDLSGYPGVPSTLSAGRDHTGSLPNPPFTGGAGDNKQMPRLDAQSPNQPSQAPSSHTAPQQTMPYNFFSYFYPGAVMPGTAGFQYPMYPIPPVTNTAAAAHVPGTTSAAQLPKTYGNHQGFPSKGTGSNADMNTGGYKSHTQGFDKFPGGTPPPFGLQMGNASQPAHIGGPAAPYGAPYLPMMPPQPHGQQMMPHPMQQDAGSGAGRPMQQGGNPGKTGAGKPYAGGFWPNLNQP